MFTCIHFDSEVYRCPWWFKCKAIVLLAPSALNLFVGLIGITMNLCFLLAFGV